MPVPRCNLFYQSVGLSGTVKDAESIREVPSDMKLLESPV